MRSRKHKYWRLSEMILSGNVDKFLTGTSLRDFKTSLILFLSILLFLLIWVPWCIAYALFKYYPEKVSLMLLVTIYLLFQLNSMTHPFLYARSITDIGQILTRWFVCCFCQSTEIDSSMSPYMRPKLNPS